MSGSAILAMALAMLVLAVTPGPGVMAVIGRALASGLPAALAMAGGIVVGDLVFLFAAVFGLAALAQAMGDLFAVVRLLGGLYLVWLGVRAWTAPPPPLRDSTGAAGHWGGWMSGLLITLGNPKVILFYLGFLPTFIDVASLSVSDLLVLSTVVSSVLGAVLGGYALLAARARAWVRSRRARLRLNRLAGGVMIATGGVLIARH